MQIQTAPRRTVELNLSPLIDVIFILVIFVVLVARFIEQNQLDIQVPESKVGKPATLEALIINLTRDGLIIIGESNVPEPDVEDYLKPLRHKHERVLLFADSEIALQKAVTVLSAARSAGFEKVSLATKPKEGGKGEKGGP